VKGEAALLVANYSNNTGYAWNNIYRLYGVIAKALHQQKGIDICASFAEIEGPVDFYDADIGVTLFEFDPMKLSFTGVVNLLGNVRKSGIRYVYFTDQEYFHWLYMLLRLSGVKKIVIHDRMSVLNPLPAQPEKGLKKITKLALCRMRFICATRIYAVSHFVRNRLIEKNCIPENRVVRILNGINVHRYNGISEGKEIDNELLRVFVCGRATAHKGLDTLIDSVSILVNEKNIKNFEVYYAGDGPLIGMLKSRVSQLKVDDYFVFLGELSNTNSQLKEADIVVVPSAWGDACPSSVSEALSSSKPLICTAAGGIPEMVGDAKNAMMVTPSEPHEMAEALAELILDDQKRSILGANARARAVDSFDEGRYHEQVLNQLLEDFALGD
jgi:glycosyltransferase involved in cell wall biosynthesis